MMGSSSLQQRRTGRMSIWLISMIVFVSVSTLQLVNAANVERVMVSGSDEYATAARPVSTRRRRGSSATTTTTSSDDNDYASYNDLLSTREEILATREHRKQRLYTMIEDMEHQLQQDLIGRRMLGYAERVTLEKRLNAYRKKLETLEPELDDRQVDRILAREEIRAERHRERNNSRRSDDEL